MRDVPAVLPASQASQTLLVPHSSPLGSETQRPPRALRPAGPGSQPACPWHLAPGFTLSQPREVAKVGVNISDRELEPGLPDRRCVRPSELPRTWRTGPRPATSGWEEEGAGTGLGEGLDLEGKGTLQEWPGVPAAISEQPDARIRCPSATRESQGRSTSAGRGVQGLVSTVSSWSEAFTLAHPPQPRRGRTGLPDVAKADRGPARSKPSFKGTQSRRQS